MTTAAAAATAGRLGKGRRDEDDPSRDVHLETSAEVGYAQSPESYRVARARARTLLRACRLSLSLSHPRK